jgi:hypothetical protein
MWVHNKGSRKISFRTLIELEVRRGVLLEKEGKDKTIRDNGFSASKN